jgi:DtxR family Mn-dependent transcriptional regulator
MATSTVEDYVKAIELLQGESPTGEATVVRIAATLGVTKGTVTAMVRKLRDAGLAEAEPYGGITLTPRGRTLAMDIIRRHRLIEVFLVEVLGLDWAEVHEEAERLEHAMSRKVLDRLDAFLGRPAEDPHGDPIPDANGKIQRRTRIRLGELARGERGTVARISDQDPEFLGFAAAHGLKPGCRFEVIDTSQQGDSITVRAHRHEGVSLSLAAANRILVERAGKP